MTSHVHRNRQDSHPFQAWFHAGRSGWLRCGRCVLLVLLVLLCPTLSAGDVSDRAFSARVTKVIDGDSLVVSRRGRSIEVRLWGIDAPEYDQPFAGLAKKYLLRSLQGRRVRLTPVDMDKYNRLVALVDLEGDNINEQLIARGYAWVHIYYCRRPICAHWRQLQSEAKRERRGLWQAKSPVPPWQWKRR